MAILFGTMTEPSSHSHPSESDREVQIEFDRAIDDQTSDPLGVLVSLISAGARRSLLAGAIGLEGEEIENFTLIRLVGIGGMGATYEAHDEDGRRVAIKVVGTLSDAQGDRFESECNILRRLRHHGIVRYSSHGIMKTGNGFLVMEFIDGCDLQSLLDSHPGNQRAIAARLMNGASGGSPDQTSRYQRRILRLLAKTADALACAHDAGLIHRDIKPANILIKKDLEPTLIDFGLGRDLFRSVSLTQSGAVMGTLSYMAPEQLAEDGIEVDARADVFSMGLVLYRCLVGEDLRRDARGVLEFGRHPLLLPGARGLEPKIQAILYKCLDPRPSKRYADAAELAADLHATLGHGETSARVPSRLDLLLRKPGARSLFAAMCLVVLSVLILVSRPAAPHLLHISVLNDGGDLYLDGEGPVKTPHSAFEVLPGGHEIEYRSEFAPTIRRPVFIAESPRHSAINLLSISHNDPIEVSHTIDSGDDTGLLLVWASDPLTTISIDNVKIEGPRRWIRVSPGTHLVEATDPLSQHREIQAIKVLPNELNPIYVLPKQLMDVPGSYRFTLGSVLSPLPQDKAVRILFESGAVPFMNEAREPRPRGQAPGSLKLHSCVTSTLPHREATATLQIDFPERMRSLVFYANYTFDKGSATMTVEYSIKPGEWHKPAPGDEAHLTKVLFPFGGGTRQFTLRARMRVRDNPGTWATARFLASYVDDPAGPHPAFAIVADPNP